MKSLERLAEMDDIDLDRTCRLEIRIAKTRDRNKRYRGVCHIWWGLDCVAEIWTKKTWATKNKAARQSRMVFQVLRRAEWPMEIVDDIEDYRRLLDAKGFE
jgi:hypothetical protein|tara:strand:- start:277 stop:579 length:303 start_codon:yes stop_codon:yes gene_type:complete